MTSYKVIFISSDNERFPVDLKVAEKSLLIKNMISDLNPNGLQEDFEVQTPNVKANVLTKVLEWCEHYKNNNFLNEENEDSKNIMKINDWDKNFLSVDQEMLYQIILTANYLNIRPLLDSGCKLVAELIKGKTAEELRTLFNIVNDFTPEEEEAIRKENKWAEDS